MHHGRCVRRILWIDILITSCEDNLKSMPQYIWSDKLTLVQVIVWRRETKKHYPNQCWSRFMSLYASLGHNGLSDCMALVSINIITNATCNFVFWGNKPHTKICFKEKHPSSRSVSVCLGLNMPNQYWLPEKTLICTVCLNLQLTERQMCRTLTCTLLCLHLVVLDYQQAQSWLQTRGASYQIHKYVGCACAGNAGIVFPATAG